MSDLESVYNDKKSWVFFEKKDGSEIIGVYRRCTNCGRFITVGQILVNTFYDELKIQGFICKKCGEVEPYYDRDCK